MRHGEQAYTENRKEIKCYAITLALFRQATYKFLREVRSENAPFSMTVMRFDLRILERGQTDGE